MHTVLPVLFFVVAPAASVYAYRRRERRAWAARQISGGRKSLVLNLWDRRG